MASVAALSAIEFSYFGVGASTTTAARGALPGWRAELSDLCEKAQLAANRINAKTQYRTACNFT
jgi:hypothetical protein